VTIVVIAAIVVVVGVRVVVGETVVMGAMVVVVAGTVVVTLGIVVVGPSMSPEARLVVGDVALVAARAGPPAVPVPASSAAHADATRATARSNIDIFMCLTLWYLSLSAV